MKTINVGITSIGSGVGQSIIDSCRLSNLPLKTHGYGVNPFAFGAFSCDIQRNLPEIYSDNYIDALLEVCKQDDIHILIPSLDDELLLLKENINKFNDISVIIPLSSHELIELCRDKAKMSDVLNDYGDFFVQRYNKHQLQELAAQNKITYPLLAKPKSGFASRGLMLIRNKSDIALVRDDQVIQEIAAPASSDPNYLAFTQALENGEVAQLGELSLQLVFNKKGDELGRFASYNKLVNGVPIEIIPADVPEAWAAVEKFLPKLREYGIYGPLNLQGRMTEAGPKFFEMNARFTGLSGLRAMTGFNEVEAIIADALILNHAAPLIGQNYKKVGLRQVTNKVVNFSHTSEMGQACKASSIFKSGSHDRNILVTGANSYVGRAVLEELLNSRQTGEIFALVRNPKRFNGISEPTLPDGVITLSVDELMNGNFNLGLVDVICHIASARPVSSAQDMGESLAFSQFLTSLAAEHQISGFVNISSQSVYGTHHKPMWHEGMPVAPETPYAQSKWASELMTNNINQLNPHCSITSLRLGRVFGPGKGKRYNELPHKYTQSALLGENLSV